MKEITYTTGELAKRCNVSIRTVQYYDREKIVQPSIISEGGRRLYTEDDMQRFQLACLYRNLEISLKEIKAIMSSDDQYAVLLKALIQQQHKIDNQIQDLTDVKGNLCILIDEITVNKKVTISNNEELIQLCLKQKRHKKIDNITYLLLGCYMIILLIGAILGSILGGIYVYIIIGMDVLILGLLIYMHATNNAYVCSNCHKKFTIGYMKDAFTLQNGKKGKYIKCPYCKQRNWLIETYKDN